MSLPSCGFYHGNTPGDSTQRSQIAGQAPIPSPQQTSAVSCGAVLSDPGDHSESRGVDTARSLCSLSPLASVLEGFAIAVFLHFSALGFSWVCTDRTSLQLISKRVVIIRASFYSLNRLCTLSIAVKYSLVYVILLFGFETGSACIA
jgi:hypothetical protein